MKRYSRCRKNRRSTLKSIGLGALSVLQSFRRIEAVAPTADLIRTRKDFRETIGKGAEDA